MNATVEIKKETDRLCLEQFALTEDAIATIATMIGFAITELIKEEDKESPDGQKIEELEKTLKIMSGEQQEIYSGNDDVKRYVVERYSPYIRERVANA